MVRYFYTFLFALLLSFVALAQQPQANFDVQHYDFSLQVNDNNDTLVGKAVIEVVILKNTATVSFDLVSSAQAGRGMQVLSVDEDNKPVFFKQQKERLEIATASPLIVGEHHTFTISYKGIPGDGLIISTNKYGHRTFFADNWPNRAHHWLPCIDHPADKASVDFTITSPDHYQVVANGIQIEETNLANHFKRTHWKETALLATKVMAVGIADFAVNYVGDAGEIPVYSWVFPEDRDKGFYDYAQAVDILPFFQKNVGPYPYRKLANVQSKTRFGGLENANTIFYFENSVTGTRHSEALLTHEIAHQWFGNSATETNWPHLWLSEGFATYMTNLYLENKYGRDTLVKLLQGQRAEVIGFAKSRFTPIVDTTATDYMDLLNANSYQKGGWVLHMLRNTLGDSVFYKCIQAYYAAYKGKNASTDDFRKIVEKVSGQNLQVFFNQWFFTSGHPILSIQWKYLADDKTIQVAITQKQATVFSFPLEFSIATDNKESIFHKVDINDRVTIFSVPVNAHPVGVVADPETKLLFEKSFK